MEEIPSSEEAWCMVKHLLSAEHHATETASKLTRKAEKGEVSKELAEKAISTLDKIRKLRQEVVKENADVLFKLIKGEAKACATCAEDLDIESFKNLSKEFSVEAEDMERRPKWIEGECKVVGVPREKLDERSFRIEVACKGIGIIPKEKIPECPLEKRRYIYLGCPKGHFVPTEKVKDPARRKACEMAKLPMCCEVAMVMHKIVYPPEECKR